MAANYVKFRRGTPEEFNLLKVKDSDTLYFISNPEDNFGTLYLGDKIIAGDIGAGEGGVTNLKDLQDVLIGANLADSHILVYDVEATSWINKPLLQVLPRFIGATATSAGVAGLVPAPGENQTNLFLRSDGQWAAISTSGGTGVENNIFTAVNSLNIAHLDLIATQTKDVSVQKNDIFIVKDIIFGENYQHTAYVFDGAHWIAMTGNYNIENVYFDEDLRTTFQIGSIPLVNGQATIPAAGKNFKQLWDSIFIQEKNPQVTAPEVTISLGGIITSYEVGTTYSPKYSVTFTPGSYEYGPNPTGVTMSSIKVTDSNMNEALNTSGSLPSFIIMDDTVYSISAEVTYTDGDIPITNTGNEYAAGRIKGATVSGSSAAVTGYRNSFYGTLAEPTSELTSDIIRTLTPFNKKLIKGATIPLNIPVGARKVIISYPASLGELTTITDRKGLGVDITNSFKRATIAVEGAEHYSAVNNYTYTLDFAEPYDTANIFDVTI